MTFENSLHYVSFADRPVVEDSVEEYDSLILPSHLIAGGSGAVPTLLNRLVSENEVEFYIDPAITQLRVGTNFLGEDNEELGQWFEKLTDALGSPVPDIVKEKTHIKYDNHDKETLEQIAEAILDFQENFVYESAQAASGKYDIISDQLSPRSVIPWYVKITEPADVSKNRHLIEHAISYSSIDVKPCIFTTKRFLRDQTYRASVVAMLEDTGPDEVFLWIEGMDKSTDIGPYLNIIDLVDRLSDSGVAPHFMNGHYFVNLLSYFGATGTGFGVFHSESKSEKTEDTGGDGSNLNRYYFDPVKEFLNITDVERLTNNVDTDLCTCTICSTELSSWDDLFRVGDDWDFLRTHYISIKRKHTEKVHRNTLEDLLEQIEQHDNDYSSHLGSTGSTKDSTHLYKWKKAIEIYIERQDGVEVTDFDSPPKITPS